MILNEILDLGLAFKRMQYDGRNDPWPDVVGYRDYKVDLEQNLAQVKQLVAEPGSYRANLLSGIDIPKRKFTLRPGAALFVEDRLVYQALADLLMPHFQPEPCVRSNRPLGKADSPQMFSPGVDLWLEFQNQVEAFCSQFPFMVETDLTAYYEHIDQNLLLSRLQDLFGDKVDEEILNAAKILLKRLVNRWYRNRHGIPQTMDPSSLFADMYLDALDKWMIRHGYTYLRYVDDMRIFADSEPNARKAFAELIRELRRSGLHVSSAKTAIKSSDDVLKELSKRHVLNSIEDDLRSGQKERLEAAAAMLEEMFLETVDDPDNFNDRHFRYCVNRFKKLKVSGLGGDIHQRVVAEILRRLSSMPSSTDVFVDYLSLYPDDVNIQIAICDFLEGPYNIYAWQEMLLLELLIRSNVAPGLHDRLRGIAGRVAKSGHPACQAKAVILRGKNGDYQDRREIRESYDDEAREDVRRGIVVAIQEMQQRERDSFYSKTVSQDNWHVQMTAKYIRQLSEPTYHYFNPPSGYSWKEDHDSDDLSDLGSEYFL